MVILLLKLFTFSSFLKRDLLVSAYFQNSAQEAELETLLKNRLTKLTPPGGLVNNSVEVCSDLYQIVDVDEKNGMINLKIWMYVSYKLEEPLWEPSDFGNTTKVQFPTDTFWRPDLSE